MECQIPVIAWFQPGQYAGKSGNGLLEVGEKEGRIRLRNLLGNPSALIGLEMNTPKSALAQICHAFTLMEVVVALAVATMVFAGIVLGYVQSTRRAEWSGYSLAAQALALQQLEAARSAKWDPTDTPAVDEIDALPRMTVSTLDLPVSGTNTVLATNYVTVSTITLSTNPMATIHMVRVSTVWPFRRGAEVALFTNTLANYYSPDR
jgi:prepilin-type N-terminal cleavage/methylation domain-containing protein